MLFRSHNIDRLISFGIKKIYISVKYLGEQIVNYLGDGSQKGISIEYVWEDQFLFEGVDLAIRDLKLQNISVKCQLMSYWDFVDDATIDRLYPEGFTGWDLEHGGVLETSLMLLIRPELVHMDRVSDDPPAVMPNYDVLPIRPELTPPSGCLSSAKNASKETAKIGRASCRERV